MVSSVRLGKCKEDREETEGKKEIQNASLLGCLVAALDLLVGWAGWCGLRWIWGWAAKGWAGLGSAACCASCQLQVKRSNADTVNIIWQGQGHKRLQDVHSESYLLFSA